MGRASGRPGTGASAGGSSADARFTAALGARRGSDRPPDPPPPTDIEELAATLREHRQHDGFVAEPPHKVRHPHHHVFVCGCDLWMLATEEQLAAAEALLAAD